MYNYDLWCIIFVIESRLQYMFCYPMGDRLFNLSLSMGITLLHILAIFLILAIIFVIYRKTRSYLPKLYFNREGKIVHLVTQMQTLTKPYRPTWWLVNRHQHTIRGMRDRLKSKMTDSARRELLVLPDGGTSALDWFEDENLKEDSPICIIIHTLAGGTREPCSNNIAEMFVKKKCWRSVVANNRCCSGAPITSRKTYNIIEWEDTISIVKRIREEFPKTRYVFIVGFSMGAYQTIGYASEGKAEQIDGIACVSHTYNPDEAARVMHDFVSMKVYQPFIMSRLHRMIEKSPFIKDKDEVMNTKTMDDFDRVFTCKELIGFDKPEDIYERAKVYQKIPKLGVPCLFIGSDDDPFTAQRLMPLKECEESDNAVLVRYPEGGHVSFLTGNDGNKSIHDEIVIEWFDLIIKDKEKKNKVKNE